MKKKLAEMTKDELEAELEKERERSAKLQRDNERAEEERERARKDEEARLARTRADVEASKNAEPTEEQWVALEAEYEMDRKQIRAAWKIAQKANAPLHAELQTLRARDASSEAVRLAKEHIRANDPQLPKYERFVDEYLADIPMADKADPDKLKRHMERAVHFGRGKARAEKVLRDDGDETISEGGGTEKEKEAAKSGFGEFAISGMPLTIKNERLVPDDFRKRHAHPDKDGAVRMDEKARWKEQIPVKPR